MNTDELADVFREASERLCEKSDRCERLIYPLRANQPIVREPEVMHAITTVVIRRGIDFGIEVPTKGRYIISGVKPDRANIDIVIAPGANQINVELKEGQPSEHSLQKDFMKLRSELCAGCAFFHVLQKSNKATLPTIIGKYASAYENSSQEHQLPKWFMLYILIRNQRMCRWKTFDDVTCIPKHQFDIANFMSARF